MNRPPATSRRQRYRAEARRTILDATEALLLDGGYEGFSMRRLARRCGTSAPTIYHYFGDKQGLLDALLEERLRRLVAQLKRARCDADPVDEVRALALAFVRFGLRNPAHHGLLMLPRDPTLAPLAAGEKARALLEAPLERLAEAGRLRVDDARAAGQSLWALLHGVISLRTTRPDHDWAPKLVENGIDALIRGLVSEAAPACDGRGRR